jgi:hypothetical protein
MDESPYSSVTAVPQNVEKKRREALLGPDEKDAATGKLVGVGEAALIGAPKATMTEQVTI